MDRNQALEDVEVEITRSDVYPVDKKKLKGEREERRKQEADEQVELVPVAKVAKDV